MKLLDIIIPTFGKPEYLNNTLEALSINIKNKDLVNLIIIDDASKYYNERKIIINKYTNIFNINLLHNEINLGPGLTRQKGLDIATSKFVAFLDDDDLVLGDPTEYCDNNYDIISTNMKFGSDGIVYANSLINPIYGIIFKLEYLQKNNFKFISERNGMEDSLFRAITLLCTNKIKFINNKTYYQHLSQKDSCYHRTTNLFKEIMLIDEKSSYFCLFIKYYYSQLLSNISNINCTMYLDFINIIVEQIIKCVNIKTNYLSTTCWCVYISILNLLLTDNIILKIFDPNLKIEYKNIDDIKNLICFIYKYTEIKNDYLYLNLENVPFNFNKFILLDFFNYVKDIIAINYKSLMNTLIEFNYNYYSFIDNEFPISRKQIRDNLKLCKKN